MGRELGLEVERQLPVGGLDECDRRLERRDGTVRLTRPGQRVCQQARARRQRLRLINQLDRCCEVLDCLGRCDSELGGAEVEEHSRHGLFGGWLRNRAAEPCDCCGGGSPAERVGGHPTQELHALRVAGRLGADDLSRHSFVGGTGRGEDPRGPRVGLGTLVGADSSANGFADDRVRELEALHRSQDPQRDQAVRGAGRVLSGELGQERNLGEARAVADHGDRVHERRRGRPPGEVKQHGVRHGLGTDLANTGGLAHIG